MPLGAIIGGATSILGGILQHNAANEAAQQQAKAAAAAGTQQTQAGTNAQNAIESEISRAAPISAPYTSLGASTSQELLNALQPGGTLTQGWNQTFSAPTAAQAAATPGYQFQLQQGLNALQNSAAARGGLLSTGTSKNLEQYAQGLASTNYQNTFNNALQAYGTNYSTWRNNQNDLFSRLFGTSQLGENAANSLNALQGNMSADLARNFISNAQLVGNDIMGVGNAQAAGTIGSTNALTGGLAGAANQINQGLTLQKILGAQNASNYDTSIPSLPSGYTPPEAIINYAGGA